LGVLRRSRRNSIPIWSSHICNCGMNNVSPTPWAFPYLLYVHIFAKLVSTLAHAIGRVPDGARRAIMARLASGCVRILGRFCPAVRPRLRAWLAVHLSLSARTYEESVGRWFGSYKNCHAWSVCSMCWWGREVCESLQGYYMATPGKPTLGLFGYRYMQNCGIGPCSGLGVYGNLRGFIFAG
jgi:hypothetical protein